MKLNFISLPLFLFFSCTKQGALDTETKEPNNVPVTIMGLPNHSQILSGQIYLDPVDGHYKSAAFDFGSQLTHPTSGYVTGQAGVGINSIEGRNGDLIAADISGDRFTAYLISFPNLNMPPSGPSYSVEKVQTFQGYEVDKELTIAIVGNFVWAEMKKSTSLYWSITTNKYYSLDSIKFKAKGGKLKSPLITTELSGPLFSPNSDGIIIYKGRILMNTESPSGMAIYPYDTEAIGDVNVTTDLGTYYLDGDINNFIIFRGNSHEIANGGGLITAVLAYMSFEVVPTGSFRVEKDLVTGKDKFYVTCTGVLSDGRTFSLNDELLSWGVM